jgi:tRNA (guanine37-N1)-methyltransferase
VGSTSQSSGDVVRIDIVSIFPAYFSSLDLSLIGKARARRLVDICVHDLRAWTTDRHHTVDDTPYGGGAGMVMRPEPWGAALDYLLDSARTATRANAGPPPEPADPQLPPEPADTEGEAAATSPLLVVPTPAGERFTQPLAGRLARSTWLIFACGRYEGIDQRVIDHYAARIPVLEISLGDYVLSGGEVAALAMIEAVVRLLPGVVGNPESLLEESHAEQLGGKLLEYPVYTKPAVWRGRVVPEVLLSGDHAKVQRWRNDEALRRTISRRPDLSSDDSGSDAIDPAADDPAAAD